jgi:hypothetical protein
MKNYPLWRFKRPGIKTINTNISEQINPMLLALLLCANHKTVYEVSINLTNTLGIPVTQLDFSIFSPLLISYETVTKANKISGLNEMRKQINQSENPALIGMMAGFEHGAKYGINAFKQIWYLRIDAMSLSEQMGWKVGRNIKSF